MTQGKDRHYDPTYTISDKDTRSVSGRCRWKWSTKTKHTARNARFKWLLFVALIGLKPISAKAVEQPPHRLHPMAIQQALITQPIRFEPLNSSGSSAFVGRGIGYALSIGATVIDISLSTAETITRSNSDTDQPLASLRMHLIGANKQARALAMEPLESKTHYIVGSNPRSWRTNVASYAKVSYDDVYPGIDVAFYGRGDHLEYDFAVAPGADPAAIRLGFEGVKSLELDKDGALLIGLDGTMLRQEAPVAYQAGDTGRQPIEARYVLVDGRSVRVYVGAYDRARELVIDPLIKYSTPFIGEGGARDAAIDSSGNLYIAGTALSFAPLTANITDQKLAIIGAPAPVEKGSDVLVLKISSDGSTLVYATIIGGNNDDEARGIAVDSKGHAYVVGNTTSPDCAFDSWGTPIPASCPSRDFPTTPSAFIADYPYRNRTVDGFVLKLKTDGSGLAYSTFLGGSHNDYATDVAVDAQGAAYVTGWTVSADFPTAATTGGNPPFLSARQGDSYYVKSDAFMTVIAPSGSSLRYSTYLGGTSNDYGYGIALDNNGRVCVTGETSSTDFPQPITSLVAHGGDFDAFVTCFDKTGYPPISRLLGGKGEDQGRAIACDVTGVVYVAGNTRSSDFPVSSGAFDVKCGKSGTCDWDSYRNTTESDAFVTKLDKNGAIVYSTFLGGDGEDIAYGLAVDAWGRAHVGGKTLSTDFPTTTGGERPCKTTGTGCPEQYCLLPDGFVTRLDATGSKTDLSMYLGGTTGQDAGDLVYGLAVDSAGRTYVAGVTLSPGFPYTAGAYKSATPTALNVFALALEADCNENGIGDPTDITSGTSKDINKNAIPDECELIGIPVPVLLDPLLGTHFEFPGGSGSIFFLPGSEHEELLLSIKVEPLPPPPPPESRLLGRAHRVEASHPDGSVCPSMDGLIEVTLLYDPAEIENPEELRDRDVFLYVFDEHEASWLPLQSFIDPDAYTVTARTELFGLFAIFISER
jgi:hypothetical protein